MIIEQTDQAQPLTLSEIIARLGAEGISAERKTLFEDFSSTQRQDMDQQH